ncbi:peptidoglycan DD-metalloendopeptidase family protein [Patescibacteria group bacterium]|nr:peptidoglycan DD-metalloendopeptidase family protein [Patescibacteria group bacterium]
MGKRIPIIALFLSIATAFFVVSIFSFSAVVVAAPVEDVDNLNAEVANRKAEIEQINKKMDEYKQKISQYSRQTASLLNDLSLIENQITLAELDVQATQTEIEAQQLEIKILEEQIRSENEKLLSQKAMLKEMIFALYRRDNIGFVEVMFGADDFGELFEELDHLETVNSELNQALDVTKNTKDNLELNRENQENGLDELVALQGELKMQAVRLDSQRTSKDVLIDQTQSSEAQYRVLMSELRQDQQYITSQINQLQAEIESKLAENGDTSAEVGVFFTSPVDSYVTTATFHDPTYPFRHLWEHSGHDMAAPMGTPIKASAPGIVAWTKTGNSYGNYVMVIHQGGYATLYAHMSRFNTSAGSYVERGQVIGYMGSTGFSTGSHLHFEVRINGIPVNPASYVSGL